MRWPSPLLSPLKDPDKSGYLVGSYFTTLLTITRNLREISISCRYDRNNGGAYLWGPGWEKERWQMIRNFDGEVI
jgi:hypothetical protein